ncbi:MAG: DNA methyltransferase [Ignavibacteriales bacterium]
MSDPARAGPRYLDVAWERTCSCPPNHLNCMDPKDWLKAQIGVWQFYYEARDIRDKSTHPAAFPISLAARCISLFTHEGELVLDPFAGSGTTLVASADLNRNAVGFDLNPTYAALCRSRLANPAGGVTRQLVVCDDARNVPLYIQPGRVSLILTSPPYANLLNRRRKNKSRRGDLRQNEQYGRVEQYSQDPRDLGTLGIGDYAAAVEGIFAGLLPLMRPRAHCVVNIPDMWWDNRRITLHIEVVEALRRAGFELRNTIIWDRTNVVNRVGIFGWPNNYITMGVTFEYLLDFWRP